MDKLFFVLGLVFSRQLESFLSGQRDFQQHVVTQRKPEPEIVAPYFLVIAAIQLTKSFVR